MSQWIAILNTGRFGDWVVVEAEDEREALSKLTRTQKKKLGSLTRFRPTSEREAEARASGVPFPVMPKGRRGRGRA